MSTILLVRSMGVVKNTSIPTLLYLLCISTRICTFIVGEKETPSFGAPIRQRYRLNARNRGKK